MEIELVSRLMQIDIFSIGRQDANESDLMAQRGPTTTKTPWRRNNLGYSGGRVGEMCAKIGEDQLEFRARRAEKFAR